MGGHLKISQFPFGYFWTSKTNSDSTYPPIYGVSKFNGDIIFFAPPPGGGWGPWGAISKFNNSHLGTSGPRRAILTVPIPLFMGSVSSMVTLFFCPTPRGWVGAMGGHLKISQFPFGYFWTSESNSDSTYPPIYGVSKFNGDINFFAPPPGGGWGPWGPSQNFTNPSLGTFGTPESNSEST